MPMVAQQAPYTLFIVDDEQPTNPREEAETFGKMVCWHNRYHLGDEHDYGEPQDLLSALEMENDVILPLYLYDHGGITMNTSGFSCPWDSGQVGWIYADTDRIKQEFGEITPETLAKARELLEAEVKEYDYYLTGQCYGFKLYEGDTEIESCWGFLGEMADVSKHIREHLPSECENIMDFLEYHPAVDEDEYLEQVLELEEEDEMEM